MATAVKKEKKEVKKNTKNAAKSIAFELNISKAGRADLIFDLKGENANILSTKVMQELEGILDNIKSDKKIKALVISGAKEKIFIAGADIAEIKDLTKQEEALKVVSKGQEIFNKIEELPFPSIIVINGACMGGGTEMALACDYRIATESKNTKIALPEVNLGIFPGFGGTQRLPKLIGLTQSLKIILSGKAVNTKKAKKIGLIDMYCAESYLKDRTDKFVADVIVKGKRKNVKKARKFSFLEDTLVGRQIVYRQTLSGLMKKTKGNYPAPLKALEVIKKTYKKTDLKQGLAIEAKEFCEVAVGDISKNLVQLFYTNEEIKKDNGSGSKIEPIQVNQAALLGAGVMGGGIAWLFSKADIPIRMKDINWSGIGIGYKQINKIYTKLVSIRKFSKNEAKMKMAKVSAGLDYAGFNNVDIVVEAVVEDMNIKKKVLTETEKNVSDKCIIASNTSSLSITEMGKALKKPNRFIGMHFFNPVNRMPLVEVIPGEKTDNKTIATVFALAKKTGKTPILVENCEGFLVNRILMPYLNEAAYLATEGADITQIDKTIEDFGMPMGPFALADEIGIDVGYKVAKILEKEYGSRMKVCSSLKKIADKGLLGKKTGKGFYIHEGKNKHTNPQIAEIIGEKKIEINKQDIIDRLILIMANEAAMCLEEGIVKNAKYLDMAMIMGTGFPAFRGGLLKYIDSLGQEEAITRLKKLEKNVSKRFAPADKIIAMQKLKQKFY